MQDIFVRGRLGRIHCRVSGDGPLLFLMHSVGRSAYEFDGLAARLADRFRVVAWDQPGHGDSDRLSGHVTIPAFAEAALETAAHFSDAAPVMAGGSFGAVLALAAAELRPDGLAGVIPIELPIARDTAWWTKNWAMVEQMFTSPDEPEERTRSRFRAVDAAMLQRLRIDRHKAGANGMIQSLWAGREDADATQKRIAALRVPALFVNGDKGVAPEAAEILARLCPAAELAVIADSGHFPHSDDPDAVAAAIAARFAA